MSRSILVVIAVVLLSGRALATEIDMRCPRLDDAQGVELMARARLTLRAMPSPPAMIRVVCDATRASVVWSGPPEQRLPVDERRGLVEGVLAALERLAAPSRAPAVSASASASASMVDVAPVGPRARDPLAPLSPGGLGLAAMAEPGLGRTGLGTGGRLDIGVGLGSLVPTASEQLLGGVGGDVSSLCFTTALGVGWGAPWYADRHFGANALAGIEWLSHSSTRQVADSFVLDLGARAALPAGPFSYFAGLDARFRAAPEIMGEPVGLSFPRVSLMLSLGAVLLVDPGDARASDRSADGVPVSR